MKTLHIMALSAAISLTACGAQTTEVDGEWDVTADAGAASDADGSGTGGADAASADAASAADAGGEGSDATDAPDAAPLVLPRDVGTTDRPARIYFPPGYAGEDVPLVFLLHGYTATGASQELYFGLRRLIAQERFIYVLPDGTRDAQGNPHWNATEACCAFADKSIDDAGYLRGIIDEVRSAYGVSGVYFMGHSNGGFMSYRMACEHSDVVDGVLSLAGATFDDASDCAPEEPVRIIQVHGTADATILYDGGQLIGNRYPSAEGTASRWASYGGCDETSTAGEPLDLMPLTGAETTRDVWANCDDGARAELWTVPLGSHIPTFRAGFGQIFYDELVKN